MRYIGKETELSSKGFALNFYGKYWFLMGLPKKDFIFIHTKSKRIEASSRELLDKYLKGLYK